MLAYFSILPGIACIALSFVDPYGCPLQGPAQDYTDVQRSEICTSLFHPHQFDELTSVSKVDSISSAAGKHNCSTPSAKRHRLIAPFCWLALLLCTSRWFLWISVLALFSFNNKNSKVVVKPLWAWLLFLQSPNSLCGLTSGNKATSAPCSWATNYRVRWGTLCVTF